jgi:hypothetical protein
MVSAKAAPDGGQNHVASVPLNADALQQVKPLLTKMQDVLRSAGRKYNSLRAEGKVRSRLLHAQLPCSPFSLSLYPPALVPLIFMCIS